MAVLKNLDRLRFWRLGKREGTKPWRAWRILPAATANRNGMLVIRGLGGRLEVDGHIIRLKRGGPIAFILTILGYRNAFIEKSIWIDRLSTIEIVRPEWSLDFIRFCYPGSPNLTGRALQDGLADNALLLNPFDHRRFYMLKTRLEALIRAIGDPHTLPGKTP